jgi:hypothetical protein
MHRKSPSAITCLLLAEGDWAMRHWSPWVDQLLRALRSEFKAHAPTLTFALGDEGGVAVHYGDAMVGLWIAASRHTYRYLPAVGSSTASIPCDIMDVIAVSRTLLADFLDPPDGSAP